MQIILAGMTDRHNELVQEREWLLHPAEIPLSLCGNLFVIENLVDQSGFILIKQAPLPSARPVPLTGDLQVTSGQECGFQFSLYEDKNITTDSWTVLNYQGGSQQRTQVLHDWQQMINGDG